MRWARVMPRSVCWATGDEVDAEGEQRHSCAAKEQEDSLCGYPSHFRPMSRVA